ncbi:MAG: pectate lyase-like adhesive domain-containing protein, partial [Rhizobiaceae bacterium]
MAFETEALSRQSAGRKCGAASLAARRRHLLMSTLLTPAAIAVMLSLGTHAFAVPYSVANEAELRAALSSGDATTITFTGDIVVTQGGGGDLPAVQGNVTIDGGGHSLSGDGANRGLFVYGDSNVRIQDLTIKDTAATGGAGGTNLAAAYYYTGVPNPNDESDRHALSDLLDELERRPGFFVRRFNRRATSRECPHCSNAIAYTDVQMVDTSIVADMILLATRDAYDVPVVFPGDL